MWFIGVELEQETSAPPSKKNPGSAPAIIGDKINMTKKINNNNNNNNNKYLSVNVNSVKLIKRTRNLRVNFVSDWIMIGEE